MFQDDKRWDRKVREEGLDILSTTFLELEQIRVHVVHVGILVLLTGENYQDTRMWCDNRSKRLLSHPLTSPTGVGAHWALTALASAMWLEQQPSEALPVLLAAGSAAWAPVPSPHRALYEDL